MFRPMPNKSPDLKTRIDEQMKTVLDPELGISIVDMGLVYGVTVTKTGKAKVTMTLTTMGCPLFGVIEAQIEEALMALPEIHDVETKVVFDPPWDSSKMSESAKAQLGWE